MTAPGPHAPDGRGAPLISLAEALAVLGVLAFVAGITKRWILDPVGDAFGDLSPGAKAAIVTTVVVAIGGLVALVRLRHRTRVLAARRVVEQQVGS